MGDPRSEWSQFQAARSYVEPAPELDHATLVVSGPTVVSMINGGDSAKAVAGEWLAGSEKDVRIYPGMHALVVHYNDRVRYSLARGSVLFLAERGERYKVEGWPPVVVNVKRRDVAVPQISQPYD